MTVFEQRDERTQAAATVHRYIYRNRPAEMIGVHVCSIPFGSVIATVRWAQSSGHRTPSYSCRKGRWT